MDSTKWLFDHHIFLDKQCKNFVKQHEKQIDQSHQELNEIAKNVSNVSEHCLPSLMRSTEKCLTQFQARVLVCQQMCGRVLSKEGQTTGQPVKLKEIIPDKDKFSKSLEQQAKLINEEYDKASKDLQDMYAQMKEQLKA